ncbi:MAG TPA: TlpA disulfide reductase family protein [Actinomycetota bacterium]|nr:TlpA disulfide reductase family protein [Actinomycetota bacterium]
MTWRPLAALLTLAIVAISCGPAPPSAPEGPRPSVVAGNATTAPLLPRHADALPASDPDRFARLLDQLRGTPVLVNVWGSWCPPCEEEMPRLVAAHAEYGDRVQFVGIDILDSRTEARAFIAEHGIRFPSVFDVDDAIKPSLGQFGQPVTVFYDREGAFVTSWAGPIPEDRLLRALRRIAG